MSSSSKGEAATPEAVTLHMSKDGNVIIIQLTSTVRLTKRQALALADSIQRRYA